MKQHQTNFCSICGKNLLKFSETASKWIAEHPGKMFYPVVDAFRAAKKIHNKYSGMQ
ncbi:MAG: hypothetical protein M3299_10980 [Thermoproteota archaeon]|nr:hypothetical protein [Thermoproteota archaeon]